MTSITHINCGTLVVPNVPTVVCHCAVVRDRGGVVLIDTGIGLHDVRDPLGRLGQPLIDAGFQFNEHDTAVRRLEALGIPCSEVGDIVLTHADPDHAGGLADFPQARVHIAQEEIDHLRTGHPRYRPSQIDHAPRWRAYSDRVTTRDWFGLPARRVETPLDAEVLLVPLFGHTLGHCGVAVAQGDSWFLHVGDAYYLRAELDGPDHPVDGLAAARADDNAQRLVSLEVLRRLVRDHAGEVEMCGFHDRSELPAECLRT